MKTNRAAKQTAAEKTIVSIVATLESRLASGNDEVSASRLADAIATYKGSKAWKMAMTKTGR